jgi:hypothetical protein
MRFRRLSVAATAVAVSFAGVACDGYLRSRIKVVSQHGDPIPNALIRIPRREHDLARFTDEKGCADFGGVVAPVGKVAAVVEKEGYETQPLKLGLGSSCFVVRLASREAKGENSVDSRTPDECPCSDAAGYSPQMAARFKVRAIDGAPVELVSVRRSTRPADAWSQVTDAAGCLGVTWIISAGEKSVPLILEHASYQPVRIDVPAMEDRCYAVTLSRSGETPASTIALDPTEKCECAMFTGNTIWPERQSAKPK